MVRSITTTISKLKCDLYESTPNNLSVLKKFHDVGVESTAEDSETLESGPLGQGLKLFLCSLFPTWVMSQHDHIDVDHTLCGQARVWSHRKNALGHNHLPVVRKCVIAVLQKLQAVLITPVMTNPLHACINDIKVIGTSKWNIILGIKKQILKLDSSKFQSKSNTR